jgi:predicted Zn-dependent peptidase
MSEIQRFRSSNGVRILVEPVSHVKSAAIGLWCTTGSCHEQTDELGVSHLIEHMLFKGTPTRTAKEIAEAIEGRGGTLNAFTEKETTCYYCRVLSDDVEMSVDVLCDMVRHSLVDQEELDREKGVVLEEILRSEDEPSDHVHEIHLERRWGDHPLSRPTVGTRDSVSALGRSNIFDYLERRYRAPHVVMSVAGNVDPAKFVEWTEAGLGDLPGAAAEIGISKPQGRSNVNYLAKDIEQVHFCIGSDGCSIHDDELYALVVMDAALGGGMSSRLFQEIREKRGLAYSIGSYTMSFANAGTFTVYGGTSPKHWPLVQKVVRDELDKVVANGLEEEELERTKRLICGNMVLALEGMSGRMMRMSKNEIYHGRDVPLEETLGKIRAVTNKDLMKVAGRLLSTDLVGTTAIGPASAAE